MTFDNLIDVVRDYNPEEEKIITTAYEYAEHMHKGQYRESGEPYIVHPLNVAYSLAKSYADKASVCTALLHDTMEDTKASKEEIAHLFDAEIANLVDSLTKIPKEKIESKKDRTCANVRRFSGKTVLDVRTPIIKLFDNLDNMRTLEFKKGKEKQFDCAMESQRVYVPIAKRLGAYNVKNELEDLSFRYIDPDMYKRIQSIREKAVIDSASVLEEMKKVISSRVEGSGFNFDVTARVKNIYGIYDQLRLHPDFKVSDIHDLLSLKIILGNNENPGDVNDCFRALSDVHSQYNYINSYFKDYIHCAKDNGYQSLHTTLFSGTDWLVQTQIRTWYMDMIASHGLMAYWYLKREMGTSEMLKVFKEKIPLCSELGQLLSNSENDGEFYNQFLSEVSANHIHIYFGEVGKRMEIPSGYTVTDIGYMQGEEFGNMMVGATVNGKSVPFDYQLQTNDRLIIKTDPLAYGSNVKLLDKCYSIKTKKLIMKSLGKK